LRERRPQDLVLTKKLSKWECYWFTAHILAVTSNYSMVLASAGFFFTGDGVYRTSEGYYQLTGRLDDIINISGHRLGTAEVEDVVVRGGKAFPGWWSCSGDAQGSL